MPMLAETNRTGVSISCYGVQGLSSRRRAFFFFGKPPTLGEGDEGRSERLVDAQNVPCCVFTNEEACEQGSGMVLEEGQGRQHKPKPTQGKDVVGPRIITNLRSEVTPRGVLPSSVQMPPLCWVRPTVCLWLHFCTPDLADQSIYF